MILKVLVSLEMIWIINKLKKKKIIKGIYGNILIVNIKIIICEKMCLEVWYLRVELFVIYLKL